MIVMHRHRLALFKPEASLRVYLEGSGDPKDDHKIIGFSIDGHGFGRLPDGVEIGKVEDSKDIVI